ncbi:MAG: hypothetical protein Kow00107_07260 [Planctomycetota bacterium]
MAHEGKVNEPRQAAEGPSNLPEDITIHQAIGVLADFARSHILPEEFDKALQEVLAGASWEDLSHEERVAFLEYFVFDRRTTGSGLTPAEIFARGSVGMNSNLREKFHAISKAGTDYFQVEKIEGSRMVIRPLGTNRMIEVVDASTAKFMKPEYALIARVVEWDGKYVFTGIVHRQVVGDIQALNSELGAARKTLSEADYRREMADVALEMLKRRLAASQVKKSNADGKLSEMAVDELEKNAQKLLESGEFTKALSCYIELRRRKPECRETAFKLGLTSLKTSNYVMAKEVFTELLRSEPNNMTVALNLAIASAMTGENARAVELFERCEEAGCDVSLLPTVLNGIGIAANEMGDRKKSLKAFERAKRKFADNEELLRIVLGNAMAAGHEKFSLELARDLAARWDSGRNLDILGDVEAWSGHKKLAIEAYKKAFSKDESQSMSLRKLGELHFQAGDYPLCIQAMAEYLKHSPTDMEAMNILGVALSNAGKSEEAKSVFEEVVKRWPGYSKAWANYGKLLIELRLLKEARKAIEEALKLDSENAVNKELLYLLEEEELRRERNK